MTVLDRAFIKAFQAPVDDGKDAARSPIRPPHAPAMMTPAPGKRASGNRAIGVADVPEPIHALAPLSSFAVAAKIHDSFRAEHEVDRLTWPPACQLLLSQVSRAWSTFADQLVERCGQGQKCIAITSTQRGEGRTTVCLATAKYLSERGLRGVVVDADFENPALATLCGLATYTGWGGVLRGELPLGEALVAAIDDGMTLMPWRAADASLSELSTSQRTATSFAQLREHYDFVLLDAMPMAGQTTISDFAGFASTIRLDAAYMIQDVRWTLEEQLTAACAKMERAGLHVAGIIENFLSPPGRGESAVRKMVRSATGIKLSTPGD
jgi:Mrp family chromosome partitioning ATPase